MLGHNLLVRTKWSKLTRIVAELLLVWMTHFNPLPMMQLQKVGLLQKKEVT